MEPLFKWNLEGEGERDVKALPYVLAWFERAVQAVADDEEREAYKQCLLYIYQQQRYIVIISERETSRVGGYSV